MLESLILDSPLNGKLIPLDEVNDKIFSGGAAGRGAAIKIPTEKFSRPSPARWSLSPRPESSA